MSSAICKVLPPDKLGVGGAQEGVGGTTQWFRTATVTVISVCFLTVTFFFKKFLCDLFNVKKNENDVEVI